MVNFGISPDSEKKIIPSTEQSPLDSPEFNRALENGPETNAYSDGKKISDQKQRIEAADVLKPEYVNSHSAARSAADAVKPLPSLKAMHDKLNAYLNSNKTIDVRNADESHFLQQELIDYEAKEEGLELPLQ